MKNYRLLWLSIFCALAYLGAISTMSLAADPKSPMQGASKLSMEKAYFAAGCFWKVQFVFSKIPGVLRTRAGYMGGHKDKPLYKEVCSDKTGHAETVQVEYDPSKVSFHKLLETFFSKHDPTTLNRQGPDHGTQYRSAIFCTNAEQKKEATEYKDALNKSHKFGSPIVTTIEDAGQFFDAEEYHQDYFIKHGAVCD